jgi:heat shock protein HtpX
MLIALAIALTLWVGYLAMMFTRFSLSRRREFMADAGAIELTKNPEAMMWALMRISGHDRIVETTDGVALMCIENTKRFFGVFATHPPTGKRIAAISEMTDTPIPTFLPVERGEAVVPEKAKKNPWLKFGRRKN